ncbi:GH32 C-terminal domain-containing protein [Paenibacillus chibensis]|uniref:GH32 C-terminal domain-containing protein n=1 Tax=Paenibacillus chibensis TaxID=59846 RepID=UPI000FDC8532|nr:GH32 C-terminal domain-containing protein [Paenibacillus chibensis]MEC0370645.1 GH32 C-terminal domain-containing protein [Paenibacillus chibensis]
MKTRRGILSLCLSGLLAASAALSFQADVGRVSAEPQPVPKEQKEAGMSMVQTNLSGWKMQGKGGIQNTADGLLLTSDPKENMIAMSDTQADDFVYEADVMVQAGTHPDASLLFRSSEDGWSSYMLQIVPDAGVLRLKDAAGGAGKLNVEKPVSMKSGDIVHLKVKAEGSSLKVYWGSAYQPVIDVRDSAYQKGRLGLHVWDGAALFQNIMVSSLNGNIGAASAAKGSWQPDLKGWKGSAVGGQAAWEMHASRLTDGVYEGNVMLQEGASAGLLFRGDAQGSTGYVAVLFSQGDRIGVQLRNADGNVLRTSGDTYPNVPGAKHHLEIKAAGQRIQVFVDGYEPAAIDVKDGSFLSGFVGMKVDAGTAYFQDTYVKDAAEYYAETYRPEYHYSPLRGSASDPNGLVYFDGEYHLFHQDGGQWAHAVSRDLVHWKALPVALPWNDLGHVWSGSAVADNTNASGLFGNAGGKGLIAYYTSYSPDLPNGNQKIGLAYSNDHGRTWQYAKDRPIVVENPGKNGNDPGGWDFRDPKVVRDEANGRWIMVVSGGDHIRFFTSSNLLDWTLTDNFGYGDYVRGGVWECPDLFQLPVDAAGQRKWVLMISTGANPKTQGSDAEYFIGDVTPEGKFIDDNPAGKVLRTDVGKEFYASMSFSDMPDGRRIMLAWMTNWDYPFSFPTAGWKGQLTTPREVSLKMTDEGIRMYQQPIAELASLRSPLVQIANRKVTANSDNILKGMASGAYEIEAEIELPANEGASEFGFRLRQGGDQQTVIGYKPGSRQLFVDRSASGTTDFSGQFSTRHEASLAPVNNRIKLRIFVDESSVEVFGNDGRVVFSDLIFPDSARRGMSFYAKEGQVKVVSLQVYGLQNTWREGFASPEIVMDQAELELSQGQAQDLYASYATAAHPASSPIKWTSSRPDIAAVASPGQGHAVVQARKAGEAVITASTPNGKAAASATVRVTSGTFDTNLTGWKASPAAAKWVVTEQGIRGSYASDANYMAAAHAGNFTYEADMRLGENGGAGSILFRASEDGRSGYYFNLDPGLKAIRLFYMVDGRFEERQVLAKLPRFLQPGETYHVKIQADGPHIAAWVDGQQIADVHDGMFAEGRFGVNVFGGQAYYQHVQVSGMSDARLTETSFVNAGARLALDAAQSQNGEPVAVRTPDASSNQQWVLVPTGDGSVSIRTKGGKALDLDTGQNKLQLYDYLGYDNQRWKVTADSGGNATILSVFNGKALEVSADGQLQLSDAKAGEPRQRWMLTPGTNLER